MIDFELANNIALNYLKDMELNVNLPLEIMEVREEAFGWVFFYQSREYVMSGDFGCMLAGNSPFIVDRETAGVHVLGTAHSAEFYIKEYAARCCEFPPKKKDG